MVVPVICGNKNTTSNSRHLEKQLKINAEVPVAFSSTRICLYFAFAVACFAVVLYDKVNGISTELSSCNAIWQILNDMPRYLPIYGLILSRMLIF